MATISFPNTPKHWKHVIIVIFKQTVCLYKEHKAKPRKVPYNHIINVSFWQFSGNPGIENPQRSDLQFMRDMCFKLQDQA